MTILKHELKKSLISLIVWTSILSGMIFLVVLIYPEMSKSMDEMTNVFENMGNFTEAFGMKELNIATAIGYYGIEIGNILGLMGGFFAAYLGINSLLKEERDKTAEFLLSQPISRSKIIFQKYLAIIIQIIFLNLIIFIVGILSFIFIKEKILFKEIILLHFAYTILQIEIASICFGISSFFRKGGIGVGLGFTAILYFLNIVKNIIDSADFLKYITPYGYAEVSYIVSKGKIEWELLGIGLIYGLASLIIGFIKYSKKDIYI